MVGIHQQLVAFEENFQFGTSFLSATQVLLSTMK